MAEQVPSNDPGVANSGSDLDSDYEHAGFGGRLGWGERPALVVIDVCRAYVDVDSPLYAGVEDACASAARLVVAAREYGVPVIFTRVEYEPGGADGGMFFEKVSALACFERGNPLADWLEEPRPMPGEVVVTKQYASAFFGTSLASTLTATGIDTLVICGLSTSGCVRASGVDAVQHGFRPMVVADACGDRAPGPHEANLFDLGAKYADVVGEAEAIDQMRRLGDA
jgi:maleamate amidohydrolase